MPVENKNLINFFKRAHMHARCRGGLLLCKTHLLNLAKDELSNLNSENCSDIRAVTSFMIYSDILKFL